MLGAREQPLQNFVVFDGDDVKGVVYSLFTDMAEGLREAGAGVVEDGNSGGDAGGGGGGGGHGKSQQRGMPVPV